MLPMANFANPRFSTAVAALGLGVFALLGGLFILTQFLQFSLGYSPLGAGLRVLPISAALSLGALSANPLVRRAGTKVATAGGLLCICAGLVWVAARSVGGATYPQELPGMLLIGLGAGLLLPAGIESVLGTLAQDDAGVGSATNSTAMQVGGAVGVAVVGSVLSSRYQHHMRAVLAGHALPATALHSVMGSLGGALAVARLAGALVGGQLALAARAGFAIGDRYAMVVAAAVTGAGALLVLVALPSRPGPAPSRAPVAGG
jgi:hypothetical protein